MQAKLEAMRAELELARRETERLIKQCEALRKVERYVPGEIAHQMILQKCKIDLRSFDRAYPCFPRFLMRGEAHCRWVVRILLHDDGDYYLVLCDDTIIRTKDDSLFTLDQCEVSLSRDMGWRRPK